MSESQRGRTPAGELELLRPDPSRRTRETPLLLVHGSWHAAWCWEAGFREHFVRQGYAAYAVSLRGHGASSGREALGRTSIADFVADVASVAAEIRAECGHAPVLVGHSTGGHVVQKYLERPEASHPVAGAVLLASVPPVGVLPLVKRLLRRREDRWRLARSIGTVWPLVATPALAKRALFSDHVPLADVERHHRLLQDDSPLVLLDQLWRNLPDPARVRRERPGLPMLVLGAERDRIFLPAEIEATAAAYAAPCEIFADMAHDMMLEPGWREVAGAIEAWLARTGLDRRCPELE